MPAPAAAPWIRAISGICQGAVSLEGGIVANLLGAYMTPLVRFFAYEGNCRDQNQAPSMDQLMQAWTRGFIDDDLMGRAAMYWGVPLRVWSPERTESTETVHNFLRDQWRGVQSAYQSWPSLAETLALLNRGEISNVLASAWLQRNGVKEDTVREHLLKLRNQIPPVGDIIRFAVRDAWRPEIVERFGWDEEFPEAFQTWANRQGFGWDSRTPAQIAAGIPPTPWPKLYWRASRETPSPSQAYEMFQRLRPGRIAALERAIPGLRPFVAADMDMVLKIHDYPSGFRKQLTAIAYHKPRLVDIRRMREDGAIDDAETYEQLLDYGYSPDNAGKMRDWFRRRVELRDARALRFKASSLYAAARKAVTEAYRVGAVARAAAFNRLIQLGTSEELDRRGGLLELPADDPAILIIRRTAATDLQLIDAQEETATAREMHKVIRSRFLRGMISQTEAVAELGAGGFDNARSVQWVQRWAMLLRGTRLIFSTEKIQKLSGLGIVPLPKAALWLRNLGWNNEAIAYMLAESQRNLALAQARADEKLAKTQAEKAAAQKRQLAELEKERKRLEKEAARNGTQAQLFRWTVKGVIREPALIFGLQRQGVAPAGIERTVAEARIERAAYLKKLMGKQEGNGDGQTRT